jgi:CRISPR-associated exonuclease Cas4
MPYSDDDCIAISGLQHLAFCKRQWGLIHLNQEWAENYLTAQGKIMHERVDSGYQEFRRGVKQFSGLHVRNMELGLYGRMDVLEIEQTEVPHVEIPWIKLRGNWRLRPVEFKHGKPKDHNADLIQLCAQALCLEEMTGLSVNEGSIFYCELRRRAEFEFDKDIRTETIELAKDAHRLIASGKVPEAEVNHNCKSCSLMGFCQPNIGNQKKLKDYYQELFG